MLRRSSSCCCWQQHRARLLRPARQHSSRRAASNSNSSTSATSSSSSSSSSATTPALSASLLAKQAAVMGAASAVLGPLCDGLHSQHNVLHYAHPSVQLQLGGLWSFETCWWVPLLFGVAGIIIGAGLPLLDRLAVQQQQQQQQQRQAPAWPAVLLCIALFVSQYGLSGLLEAPLLDARLPLLGGAQLPALDVLLAACALTTWAAFDASPQGFGMSALTALCGPAVEVLLIAFGLYHYSHPEVLGVPTWIGWVYFAGGPAVGNLGRRVWCELAAQEAADSSSGDAGAQRQESR